MESNERTESGVDQVLTSGISIYNFGEYSSPSIEETANGEWVDIGERNEYLQTLIDLFHSSPTNQACINGYVKYTFGRGLEASKADRNLAGYLEFKKLIRPKDVRAVIQDRKLLGFGSWKVLTNKAGSQIVKASHWRAESLRPGKANTKGEITRYYYSPDWSDNRIEPKPFWVFPHQPKGATEFLIIVRPYVTGSFYFSPPDYSSGLGWANLEHEIECYHNANIQNGMSPSMLVNFNNGEPDQKTKAEVESKVNNKFSGSGNAGKVIISWNDNPDRQASVTPVPLSEAHSQYEFLSRESSQKVMLSHRITSPMLLGIKDNTGLGNNAEELKDSFTLFYNTEIKPMQDEHIDAIDDILLFNDIVLDLYFETISPTQWIDPSGRAKKEAEEEAGGFGFSKHDMTEEDEKAWIAHLEDKGEVIDEDLWELVDERPAEEDEPTFLSETTLLSKAFKFFERFADPKKKSQDDKGIYLIRYRYSPMTTKANSRNFCKQMVAGAKTGLVYRREDIEKMQTANVNSQFAPKGMSNYSIWRFKGGAYCHHQWYRMTYRRKTDKGKIIPLTEKEKAQGIRDYKVTYDQVSGSRGEARQVPFAPPNWDDARTKPINMPGRGKLN